VSAAAKLLGDKAYGSAELREWLSERNTNPVVPNDRIEKRPSSQSFQSLLPVGGFSVME
jgi:hypothetical protein